MSGFGAAMLGSRLGLGWARGERRITMGGFLAQRAVKSLAGIARPAATALRTGVSRRGPRSSGSRGSEERRPRARPNGPALAVCGNPAA